MSTHSVLLRGLAVALLLLIPASCAQHVDNPSIAGSASCVWRDPVLQAEEQAAAAAVWKSNLSRRYAIVHPSRAYAGVWLRDSFWTFLALGDVTLSGRALRHFANHQAPTGQVPTQFTSFLRQPILRDDESTLLFVIWSEWQARHRGWYPSARSLSLALGFVQRHVRQGRYTSRVGSYADWFDAYRLQHADNLSYNQGLYVDALLAAQQLRQHVTSSQIGAAIAAYRALTDHAHGYLRFSSLLPYHDISSLTGEFLALWLFGRPLLSNAVVGSTVRAQPPFEYGFRVVTNADGTYLRPSAFVTHVFPGDYQNGGSWLLYDYMALATSCIQGTPTAANRMADRLREEFRYGPVFHEYLNTDISSPLAQHEPAYRDGFAWDTFVLRVDDFLKERAGQPRRQSPQANAVQARWQGNGRQTGWLAVPRFL
jgi:hypothetical protein